MRPALSSHQLFRPSNSHPITLKLRHEEEVLDLDGGEEHIKRMVPHKLENLLLLLLLFMTPAIL